MRIVVLVTLIYCSNLFAQPAEIWRQTFGGAENDRLLSVSQCSDSGFVLCGLTETHATQGNEDIWLIKTDRYGQTQWQRTFGTDYDDVGIHAYETRDGGFIIAGAIYADPQFVGHGYGIKTDANGELEWVVQWPGHVSCFYDVVAMDEGGFLFVGFDDPVYRNGIAMHVSASGEMLWNEVYDYGYDDAFLGAARTDDGGFLLAGYAMASHNGGSFGTWFLRLLKINEEGRVEFDSLYGGELSDTAYRVKRTPSGTYMIAGLRRSSPASGGDAWLFEVDENGDSLWSGVFGTDAFEMAGDLVFTQDGGLIFCGETINVPGEGDVYLGKLDANREIEWELYDTQPDRQLCYSIVQSYDGNFVVAFGSEPDGPFGEPMTGYLVKYSQSGPCTPEVMLDSTSLSYGSVTPGLTAIRQVELRSLNECMWQVDSVVLPQGFAASFGLDSVVSPFTILDLEVRFTPTQRIHYEGDIEIHINREPSQFVIEVSGDGGGGFLHVQPDSIDFGHILVETQAMRQLNILNLGTQPVTIGAATVAPPFLIEFDIELELPVGMEVTLPVMFQPTVAGDFERYLVVHSDADNDQAVIHLSGEAGTLEASDNPEFIREFALHDVYPNPFNPSTTVSFSLPQPSDVSLKVYDVTGREVLELVTGTISTGKHEIDWSCSECAAGMYLIALRAGDFSAVTKAIYLK